MVDSASRNLTLQLVLIDLSAHEDPWSLCVSVCVCVCVCVCVHVHIFRLFWLKSVNVKKNNNTYIHIHGTPALMITPALATPQVLTSDMASSGLLLTCTLGFHVHKHIVQLRELEFSCHKQLSIWRSPSTSIFNTSGAPTWCTRWRRVQGHKISSSQFLKEQKSWPLVHDHKRHFDHSRH